jgi:nucleolar complex protein 2
MHGERSVLKNTRRKKIGTDTDKFFREGKDLTERLIEDFWTNRMGKVNKSTKKFQKNHLKRDIDQRRVEQKYKQKLNQNQKKKKSTAKAAEDAEKQAIVKKKNQEVFDDMSVEDFMKGGFELPKEEKKNKKQTGAKEEMESHKAELEKLKEQDPDFYNYLKQNDQELLEFDPEDMDDDEDEDEEMSEEEGEGRGGAVEEEEEEEEESGQIEVTLKDVNAWKKSLSEENSLRTLKKVLKAFTAAVNYSQNNTETSYKYVVNNAEVFNRLLILTLSKAPATIKHHIPLTTAGTPAESKKLKSLSQALRTHAHSLTVLLSGRHDDTTSTLILKSTEELLPYFLSYRRLLKGIVTAVVTVFCHAQNDELRLVAFDFMKNSAAKYQKSLLELTLKTSYSGFVKASRRTNVHNMPAINMQKNLLAQLFSIDPTTSYQQGFQFIRQLAIHLRSSIVNKTADSYKIIYNWQYVHSLDFWSRVLCFECDLFKEAQSKAASPLRSLIHPLVQVTLGAMRLIPTPQYFPLRFYLIRSLLRLSTYTGVYIPLLPALTEVLNSTTVNKTPKPSTLKPLDFDHNIRAGKSYLGTRVYQDSVCEQLVELIAEFFVLHCKSIAFPELSIPAVITLRRFIKRSKNVKFNKQLQKLVEKLEQNSKFVEQERSNVEFGPAQKEQVAAFLKDYDWNKTPLGAFVRVQRDVKAEKERILRESLAQEEADRKEREDKKDSDEDEDVDMSDLDQSDEQEEPNQEGEDEEESDYE